MDKPKKWQLWVIAAVIAMTLYNILPTVIYYSKPLSQPINEAMAHQFAEDIVERVDGLEKEAIDWLYAFCDLIHTPAKSIALKPSDPGIVEVQLETKEQADRFQKLLPQAGNLIVFPPAQLNVAYEEDESLNPSTVMVERRVSIHLRTEDIPKLFQFTDKYQENKIAPFYFELVGDRFTKVVSDISGSSNLAQEIARFIDVPKNETAPTFEMLNLARDIATLQDVFNSNSAFVKRFFQSMAQLDRADRASIGQKLIAKFQEEKRRIETTRQVALGESRKNEVSAEAQLQTDKQLLETYDNQINIYTKAIRALEDNVSVISSALLPLSSRDIQAWLKEQRKNSADKQAVYTLNVGNRNPFFKEVSIDWANDRIVIRLHPDVRAIIDNADSKEIDSLRKEILNRWVMSALADLGQQTDEKIITLNTDYGINLYHLAGSKSLLALNVKELGKQQARELTEQIRTYWHPDHPDLISDQLPIYGIEEYQKVSPDQRRLCALVCSVSADEPMPIKGLRPGSIYVVLRGIQSVIDKYQQYPQSEGAEAFTRDFRNLYQVLQSKGFIAYSGNRLSDAPELSRDFIFELADYYTMLIKATRENFAVLGSKKYAVLEFTDVEQRIITQNRIDDTIQEELLKWKDQYQAAQVDLNPLARYSVPAPVKSTLWENFKHSLVKYCRGDDRKVLRWGLDLSGGKSVRIALFDHSNRLVTEPNDLRQAVDELYVRVNKLGVAERTIRIENTNVILDFPSSQGLSAVDLVKGSTMTFHLVNERFGPWNQVLIKDTNAFLQEVWNEAVVSNRRDIRSINEIAYQRLKAAEKSDQTGFYDSARVLYDNGLRLQDPSDGTISGAFDDTISMIAMYRTGDDAGKQLQAHPLLIVFHNYALEGSDLENIHEGYDPSKGNILMFDVKASKEAKPGSFSQINPQENFYMWTSQFAEDRITGTPKEVYSQGRGWRMAVILNESVISAPALSSALKDHAMVTGGFSQREVHQLASDLKAGSLSFTPRILSEVNISPELGQNERGQGIFASIIAVIAVVVAMVGYYHFAGVIASIAVLFNVLIIWAVMQNLDAAITLPSIAGIVLTVGMAVDANVLVFERIREEFKITGRIASAIQAGYQKAFSAIIDSNLTTILAALILIQFDSGPIKGFAITLIIGVASSMFTALFMTKTFFAYWLQKGNMHELKMSQWIKDTHFDFLKYSKQAFLLSGILLAVGSCFFAMGWKSIFGMDFTGGYALVCELEEKPNIADYRDLAADALKSKGLSTQEFHIQELSRPNLIRFQFGASLEEAGRPFHGLAERYSEGKFTYDYQRNPRISWVVDALNQKGAQIKPSQLQTLDQNWTVMSGQLSDAMRRNASWALSLSLFAILLYIAFRFELNYAIAAVLALAHDVALTLAVVGIAHVMGLPVQIDLTVVGAIMTIIGYSLNDTIIVFDRIREDLRVLRRLKLPEIISHALNVTLSRTLMTSGTTLLVLIALVLFGGQSIFGFAFVMLVGVLLGTFSSLFIASPILLYLQEKYGANKRQPV